MSAKTEGIIRSLRESLKRENEKKTSGYDTRATIRRIEDGVAWVHIPGGVDETPVTLTIGANVGDEVQVRVSGGRAFLVGNATAPPTDDKYARKVNYNLGKQIEQTNVVMRTINRVVQSVKKIADNTNQYFWHTEEGIDTGAHITEIPQEEFLADPENGGGNLLARSNGIAVRDGLTELARFSADGAQIGQDGESHAVMDFRSFGLADKDGNTYFYAGDLRDASGVATITETYEGDGKMTDLNFDLPATDTDYTITYDAAKYTIIGKNLKYVEIDPALAIGDTIQVTYKTTDPNAKKFTFGNRSGTDDGALSFAHGDNVVSSGFASFATGYDAEARGYGSFATSNAKAFGVASVAQNGSEAYGNFSHAEGTGKTYAECAHAEGIETEAHEEGSHAEGVGTKATVFGQHACGRYNTADSNKALIVGNGSGKNSRSNAFTVDWKGNILSGNTNIVPCMMVQTWSQTLPAGTQSTITGLTASSLPTGATVLGCTVIGTPNNHWVMAYAYASGSTFNINYWNHATVSVSGSFVVLIFYTL